MADSLEWLERAWPLGLEPVRPFGPEHIIRVEESLQDDVYRVRAELPGLAAEDIHVTAHGGMLTIAAERKSHDDANGISEFRYGSFARTKSLPQGADTAAITADYTDGILEVTVPCAEQPDSHEVPIKVTAK